MNDTINNQNNNDKVSSSSKTKRIIAWIAIILLVSMYLVTLILALSGANAYNSWFMVSLYLTLIIPVLAYVAIKLYEKHTDNKEDEN